MSDKLIIEIDGNATGLTNELRKADTRLTTFNRQVSNSNKMLQGFQGQLGTTASYLGRLAGTSARLDATMKGLNKTFAAAAPSVARLQKSAATASSSVTTLGRNANSASNYLSKLATSGQAVNTLMTSMGRRMNALNATVSALNSALRGLTKNIQGKGVVVNQNITNTNRYSNSLRGLGNSANSSAGGINRLRAANIGLAESFRRNVAQITALRTLTYQALFWFSPLFYSIVKVNAEYEKQMVLLKNISSASSEAGKKMEASQSMGFLREMAQNAPFALETLTGAFVKLKVGGIDPTNGSLQTLVDSVAAFGGDSMNLERAAVAIQQMGGKGTVSMEELRQQLGEHVPTALKAMAQGLGYSTENLKAFYKQVELGNVSAKEGLEAMFRVLKEQNEGKASEMMNTWAGVQARLQSAWQRMLVGITENNGANSFFETLKKNSIDLTNFLNSAAGQRFFTDVQNGLKAALDAFVKVIKVAYEYRYEIIAIAKAAAYLLAFKTVISIFSSLFRTVTLVTSAFRTLSTVLNGFQFLMNATGGAMSIFSARGLVMAQNAGFLTGSMARLLPLLGSMLGFLGPIAIVLGLVAAGVYFFGDEVFKASAKQKEQNRLAAEGKAYFAALEKEAAKTGNTMKGTLASGLDLGITKMFQMAGAAGTLMDKLYGVQAAAIAAARAQTALEVSNAETRHNAMVRENDRINRTPDGGKVTVDFKTMTKADAQAYQQRKLQASYKDMIAAKHDRYVQDKDFIKRLNDYQNPKKPDTPGSEVPSAPTGPDGKKNTGPKGPKTDPLDRFRTKLVNEMVQSASLANDYNNLVNTTDNVFDSDDSQEKAEKIANLITSREELDKLTHAQQDYQKELKKSIQVEQTIYQIRDATAETTAESKLALDELERGYISIESSSEAYRDSLERQYRQEIAIIKARLESGKATEDNIRQYNALTKAINDSVRAKETSMLIDLAKEAKQANQAYDDSFLTDRQIATREGNIQIGRYSDALGVAGKRVDQLPKELVDAAADYASAKASFDATAANLSDKERAEAEIIVTGKKQQVEQLQEEQADLVSRTIPYLERRLQILREEQAIRDKFGGAGVALFNWARDAQKGFDDLGASMGNLATQGFDDLVDGLARGKLAFGDFVKSMIAGLIKIIIRALIAKAILSALGLGGYSGGGMGDGSNMTGGIINTSSAGGLHQGGKVGSSHTFTRQVPSAMFNFAQRYHTGGIVGLGPNEVPIIAERGEHVFTREQMAGMSEKQKGSNVQVNVINQTGTQAEVERKPARFDGEKWVEDIILKKMMQPGPVRTMLNAKKG